MRAIGMLVVFGMIGLSTVIVRAAAPTTRPDRAALEAYFAEPRDLAYDETILQQKQADGFHWTEFRYTSLVYNGAPIRIHAVYALPSGASASSKVPAILMTHGVFGGAMQDLYFGAITRFAKAGYAVLFIDWYADTIKTIKPEQAKPEPPCTTYGKLPQTDPIFWFAKENDFRNQLHYHAVMAARRGLTWLAAQKEIDAGKIGATGASYGGIFSSMFAGIDSRIVAVNPCVFTNGWALGSTDAYNLIRADYSKEEAEKWIERFDSRVLLADKTIPILYTIGSNDATFQMTKGMQVFAAMNEPKHLLTGPNRGHDYWDVEQSIQFFDHVLKKTRGWPSVSTPEAKLEGREIIASVKAESAAKVELYFASNFEIDPDRGPEAILCELWKWTGVEPKRDADGRYTARWTLPQLHQANPNERLLDWGETGNPAPLTSIAPASGLVRVFARVTDSGGAMACSPLAPTIAFNDPPEESKPAAFELPALESASRITKPIAISLAPTAKAVATIDSREVGTHGYVLWRWNKQEPSTSLQTEGVLTPTKLIRAPFADTIDAKSFQGAKLWDWCSGGGFVSFEIGGKTSPLTQGRSLHGSVAPGANNTEQITIDPGDDAEHRLTVVLPASYNGHSNVRVSLAEAKDNGAATTVRYRHTSDRDVVLQFRFKGKSIFRVQITSQAEMHTITQVGPSAMFFD